MSRLPPPAVSVVIPAFNRAATIGAAIQSVLRQTYTDVEVLVVDDCSTDETLAEARRISDPRVRVLTSSSNRGASAARNAGVDAARGTWIAFQDSDDEWLPRKLERQTARLAAPGADYVAAYCGMMVVGKPEAREGDRLVLRYIPKPSYRHVEGDILPTLLCASLVSTQTLVVRRDILLEVGGFDEQMPALIDAECVLRLAQRGRFAFVDQPLVLQFFSQNSITLDRRRRLEAQIRIMEKHAALFQRNPQAGAARWYDIAGAHRHFGEIDAARAALARARAARPAKPLFWAMGGWLMLNRLFRGGGPAGEIGGADRRAT